MVSRDPEDLHPLLRQAWEYLEAEWSRRHPDGPFVGLSATYRGPEAQTKAFEEGKSRLMYGESLHNFKPAFAFDIYFHDGHGHANWSFSNFQEFAELAEAIGLEWGGRWPGLVDGPHFQFRSATAADARAGMVFNPPKVPKIEEEDPWRLVIMENGDVRYAMDVPKGHAIFTRVSEERKRYFLDVRVDSA